MNPVLDPFSFLVVSIAGWLNQHQQHVIEYRFETAARRFHRWLLDGSDKRLLGDYEAEITLQREDIEEMIAQAEEFLEAARNYLKSKNSAEEKRT